MDDVDAIVTPAEMAAIDAEAPEPVDVLIERAGWAVARNAIELLGGTYGRRVVVVAGKGNNGADGRAAARHLARRGVRVLVLDATDPAALAGATLPSADLVIDAAYGTGFRGEHRPAALPSPRPPVLAVDVPSGIDGLDGTAQGEPWAASRTVTFAAWKPGLLLADGPDHTGEVVVADIGLSTATATAHHLAETDLAPLLPPRPRTTHKWRHAVWVLAGSPGMTGAAHLSTRAAQRAGAGYVRLTSPGVAVDLGAPTEAVVVPAPADDWARAVIADAGRFAALAIGPGLGRSDTVDAQLRAAVAGTDRPTVVDADGITALGDLASVRAVVAARPPGAGTVVLTPHDGEFARLTGAAPAADRFAAVRAVAASTGCVVLLKGSTTIVAAPDGAVLATTSGDARLATAGTGDVLTGIVAALLAQGLDGLHAAAAGAVLHGRAGALASARGLVAGDLVDHLPAVLTEAFGG